MAAPLLQVQELSKGFGGILAVDQVSFNLEPGTTLGLIGPNGSGKTTLLNLLNGVFPPDSGQAFFDGIAVRGKRPYQLTEMGIMRTFQNPHVFQTNTAYQNMMVPLLHARIDASRARARAWQLLEFVGLERKADLPASELSGGEQKLLEFVRALMTRPRLVLMDEPFGGMHPEIKATLIGRIRATREQNVAFILVSHEIPHLMELSERVICLNFGQVIADGRPAEVSENELVIEAYLGQ